MNHRGTETQTGKEEADVYECFARKELAGGRSAEVIPLTEGRARLCVGPAGSLVYDDVW